MTPDRKRETLRRRRPAIDETDHGRATARGEDTMKQTERHLLRRSTGAWAAALGVGVMLSWGLGSACGASAPAVVEAEPVAPVERAVRQGPDPRIWFVYYQGIHALTVFPEPGQLRPRSAQGPPPFGTRSPHFSVVSWYDASESLYAPQLAEATSAEELVERLSRVVDTEVEEAVNPAYEHLVR